MDNSYKTDIYSNNIYLKELEKREKLDLEKKESRNKESDKWNRFLNLARVNFNACTVPKPTGLPRHLPEASRIGLCFRRFFSSTNKEQV